jgi:hypothetical protein
MRLTTLAAGSVILTITVFGQAIPQAGAATIASWTYEGATTPADVTDNGTGPTVLAETGIGTSTGLHASAATDWTTPSGNGSGNSLNSNNWAPGDYLQFQASTLGLQDIQVSWDQTRSSTGPTGFKLQYSTDGSTFTDNLEYTVLNNEEANGGTWNNSMFIPNYHFAVDLNSITSLDNQATVYFRLTNTVTGTNVAGTSRVDNFTITGVIPEPATWFFLAVAGLVISSFVRKRAQ